MCMYEYASIYIHLIIFTSVTCFTLTSNNFILVGKFSKMLILWNLLRNVFDEEVNQGTKAGIDLADVINSFKGKSEWDLTAHT